jgi:Icc protein
VKRFAILLLATGCLEVADGRALIDLEVGRGGNAATSVEVAEGLATVRGVAGSRIVLWANAPTLEITLQTTAMSSLELTIENVLPDARLEGEGIEALEREVPTEGRWRVAVNGRSVVRLVTDDRFDREPWRFVVFADVQEAIDTVQDIFTLIDREAPRFALIAGDLTEQGTDEEFERFQLEMKQLGVPAYATLGNHELGTEEGLYQAYFGRGSSSFVFRGVRFTFIDSASATLAPLVDTMLDDWLDQPEPLHVVTMHIAPHDPTGTRNGAFASRAEASRLLRRLSDGGVDVTFYGHVHSYYAFDNAGIPAFITGGGGAIPERLDGIGRHFLTVDVDPRSSALRTGLVRVD